jgi:hypothetical protein
VDPSKGHRGITAFLVERGTPGLTVGKLEDKLGIRASSTAQLHFEDLKVHESRVVGRVGEGYKIAIGILNEGRVGIGAQMLGIAQGAFNIAVPYALQRKQFGQAVADFQGMQHQIAQAATDIEAARLLVYNAARLKMAADEDPAADAKEFIKNAAMAKLYASQVAERTASLAVEWMGGMGFVKASGVEKFYRGERAATPETTPVTMHHYGSGPRTHDAPHPAPSQTQRSAPFTRARASFSSARLARSSRLRRARGCEARAQSAGSEYEPAGVALALRSSLMYRAIVSGVSRSRLAGTSSTHGLASTVT